jgi:hypothetical protein
LWRRRRQRLLHISCRRIVYYCCNADAFSDRNDDRDFVPDFEPNFVPNAEPVPVLHPKSLDVANDNNVSKYFSKCIPVFNAKYYDDPIAISDPSEEYVTVRNAFNIANTISVRLELSIADRDAGFVGHENVDFISAAVKHEHCDPFNDAYTINDANAVNDAYAVWLAGRVSFTDAVAILNRYCQ